MPDTPALPDDRPSLMAALSGVLDQPSLQRLSDLDPDGSAGLLRRVLVTYAQSLARLVDDAQQARAHGDADTLRQAAHTLKSSSASVGALALSRCCAEIERSLRDGTPLHEITSVVDEMLRLGRQVLAALKAMDTP